MHRAVVLVSLLVLGSAWTPQGAHVLPETLTLTQEHFDLGRFMGQWYEVAVVSTCPHYMQRRRGNPAAVALELRHVAPGDNFTMVATTYRNGSCQRTSTVYGVTNTPGRFFHHVARFGADVDSYVVHTNYDEFAMMLMLSTERSSGSKTTILKLFSRTVDVGAAALGDFGALVRQHRMSDGAVIMNQNKGECVPGEPVTEPATRPQISVPKRSERNVVPSADSGNI